MTLGCTGFPVHPRSTYLSLRLEIRMNNFASIINLVIVFLVAALGVYAMLSTFGVAITIACYAVVFVSGVYNVARIMRAG